MPDTIPLLRPSYSGMEADAVLRVLESGWWGLGPEVAALEADLSILTGAGHVTAVNSATSALELSMQFIRQAMLKEEIAEPYFVATPTMTFASVAHAIIHAGMVPIFTDVDPTTLCMTEEGATQYIDDEQLAAIVPVHFAGRPALTEELLRDLTDETWVVEDCAHAAGSRWPSGNHVGSAGDIGIMSMHAVKNLGSPDGGAVLTNNQALFDWLTPARWCGINKSTWHRSDSTYSWQYTIEQNGWKYHQNDVAAAIIRAQLQRLDDLNYSRSTTVATYYGRLSDLPWLQLPPPPPPGAVSANHLFFVQLPDQPTRDRFMDWLRRGGVSTGLHYEPLHHHPYFAGCPRTTVVLANADAAFQRLCTIPLFPDLTADQVDTITDAIRSFRP